MPNHIENRFTVRMKSLSLIAVSLVLSLALLAAAPVSAKESAKITKNEAEHLALGHRNGARVTAAKLEKIGGKLVWSIEISGRKGKWITHVAVDAMSGRILSQTREKL